MIEEKRDICKAEKEEEMEMEKVKRKRKEAKQEKRLLLFWETLRLSKKELRDTEAGRNRERGARPKSKLR